MRDAMMMPFMSFVQFAFVNNPMRQFFQQQKTCLLQRLIKDAFFFSFVSWATPGYAETFKLGLPIDCNIDKDCFIQNLPDTIIGEGRADSFCQGATYDGHKGLDIRIISMDDIKRDVPVIASASGVVKALRDGVEDRLVLSDDDKKALENRECGNGVVISHEGGYETQYCHLKNGSVSVSMGEEIKKGDLLGFVGNSGFAAFPHVHLTVRKNGTWLDPITGRKPALACMADNPPTPETSLLDTKALEVMTTNTTRLMLSGITGAVPSHDDFVKSGPAVKLGKEDTAIIGWAWFINIRKGDQIRFTLEGPDGLIVTNTTDPIEEQKANFSAYSGKRGKPQSGEYQLTTELLREGKPIEKSLYIEILE